jgi:hypothetical protein
MGMIASTGALLNAAKAWGCRPEDPGHDSPLEMAAMLEVEQYARGTGPLGGGGTTVRAWGKSVSEVTAWLSPHYDDPIIVSVKAGRTLWAFADSADEKPPEHAWMRLDKPPEQYASLRHAQAADRIIRTQFAAHLKASRQTAEH